jgi:hypothetical protein
VVSYAFCLYLFLKITITICTIYSKVSFWLGLFSTFITDCCSSYFFFRIFKKKNLAKNRKIALFALIAIHVQLLVGIILYFVSPNGFNMIKAVGMGGLTTESRLLALEHPLINIIAIALITIGWSKHKKIDESKI